MEPSKAYSRILPAIFIILIGTGISLSAQMPRSSVSCPTISVSSPDSVRVPDQITMSASVSGGNPGITPNFIWTVSDGTIASGQGTSSVTIDTYGISRDSSVTGTVDVGGYARECSTSSSSTTSVMKKIVFIKFDGYGRLGTADENTRLDNFAVFLKYDPSAQAYIITYGGRTSTPDDAPSAGKNIENYLVKIRKVDAARIVMINGGYTDRPMTELFLVPVGAEPPMASPTVDSSEVRPEVKKKVPVKRRKK